MRHAHRHAGPLIGFQSIEVSTADAVTVAAGYRAQVLSRWGDPLGVDVGAPEFRMDGSNSAADQALQAGMHHDAIELFALPSGNALLAVNYEYTDDGLLHPDGMKTWSADKVRKSQAAHGVGIMEIAFQGGEWRVVRPSKYARRITAYTPTRMSGPAAGSAPLAGEVLGTINNCAGGRTPWGPTSRARRISTPILQIQIQSRPSSVATVFRRRAQATAGMSSTSASTPTRTQASRTSSAGWLRSIRTIRCRSR